MREKTTPFSILRTKWRRPPVTADLAPRLDLLASLDQHRDQPCPLVSAPAGYGETTLVSHWVNTLDGATARLSLDDQDDDLIVFLSCVIAALRTQLPDACQETLALLNAAAAPPPAVLARHFCNDLDTLERDITLVIDM